MLVQDGQCYFYQCDHLGTPLRLVTSQGEIVWQAHYETWGTAHIEIEQVTNPLRFQGQYYDAETGLHYNLARYYDPRTGRFIQPDPIGLLGGLNHYQYAPNPVMWVDPTGLCAKEDSTLPVDALADNPQQTLITNTFAASYQPTTLASSPVGQLSTTTSSKKSTDLEKLGSVLSVGGDERLSDDDGGHLIGHRFMNDQGLKNLFPQNANLNRGAYKTMENEWADWIAEGCEVRVTVKLDPPGAERPENIVAQYQVFDPATGDRVFKRRHRFDNKKGEEFKRVNRTDMQNYI